MNAIFSTSWANFSFQLGEVQKMLEEKEEQCQQFDRECEDLSGDVKRYQALYLQEAGEGRKKDESVASLQKTLKVKEMFAAWLVHKLLLA